MTTTEIVAPLGGASPQDSSGTLIHFPSFHEHKTSAWQQDPTLSKLIAELSWEHSYVNDGGRGKRTAEWIKSNADLILQAAGMHEYSPGPEYIDRRVVDFYNLVDTTVSLRQGLEQLEGRSDYEGHPAETLHGVRDIFTRYSVVSAMLMGQRKIPVYTARPYLDENIDPDLINADDVMQWAELVAGDDAWQVAMNPEQDKRVFHSLVISRGMEADESTTDTLKAMRHRYANILRGVFKDIRPRNDALAHELSALDSDIRHILAEINTVPRYNQRDPFSLTVDVKLEAISQLGARTAGELLKHSASLTEDPDAFMQNMQRIREVCELAANREPATSRNTTITPFEYGQSTVHCAVTLKNALGELLQADIAATLTENPIDKAVRQIYDFTKQTPAA